MDKFVTITSRKPSGRVPQNKEQPKRRFSPYSVEAATAAKKARQEWSALCKEPSKLLRVPDSDTQAGQSPAKSEREIRKAACSTLSHPGNPLTSRESILLKPLDHVWSCATGHQQGDVRRNITGYKANRAARIESQQGPAQTTLLRNCRVYCDSGYCANTTALELKRLVVENGGSVSHIESGATHILTSQSLAGAKIQKFLTQNARNKQHVVKPEWLFDSINEGKRKSEWDYTVIKNTRQRTLNNFKPGSSSSETTS